jgi:hypothetical protein
MRELPKSDIIIDINKGYALRRIGTYSPNAKEQIVHTFIPLNHFCAMSPATDVCVFGALWKKVNVVELATTITSQHTISYNSDIVSSLVGKDITRVLTQNHPDDIINNNKSIFHLINNQFYCQKSYEKALMTLCPNNDPDNYSDIQRVRPSSIGTIVKQIRSNTIDSEYLSGIDSKLFLKAIFSSMDTSYTNSNIEDN